ncbi:MAG: tetratricopeptide repeat protein [Rhizobacter sp.]|nr:tetratricopeptide repeat protein [Ferruginibacter sp.]
MQIIFLVMFRSTLFFIFLQLVALASFAQENVMKDSLTLKLKKATTAPEKIDALRDLSYFYMSVDPKQADKLAEEAIFIAEESRDRALMVKAYANNGVRAAAWPANEKYAAIARNAYLTALDIARKNKLVDQQIKLLVSLSALELTQLNKVKAAEYAKQATATTTNAKTNDTLRISALLAEGNVALANNQKTDALRFYLNASAIAEDLKAPKLSREVFVKLASFYSSIESYDKAIDYYNKAYKELDKIDAQGDIRFRKCQDLNTLGGLYAQKKNYEMALEYYNKSIGMADSLNYDQLKVPGYVSLLNVYLLMDQPKRSLDFLNSSSGNTLSAYLAKFDVSAYLDQAYGIVYTELGQLDSAGYYYNKSLSFFDSSKNAAVLLNSHYNLGKYYKRLGNNKEAIRRFLLAKDYSQQLGELNVAMESSKYLDTLYRATGDYENAALANGDYYKFKDSIQTVNKEKEVTQLETAYEQEQQEKAALIALEKKRQRNNIQYLAITIGIVSLFLVLVLFGMFNVSARTIRMVGFFAFLMFFEFIFLIFKKNIYSITHGEPWMDLLFMIGLAAILLPLHHWIEHKVLHILTSQNRFTNAGSSLKKRFSRKDATIQPRSK